MKIIIMIVPYKYSFQVKEQSCVFHAVLNERKETLISDNYNSM
jgi:hypothetical protein